MKKISLFLVFLFASTIAFSQSSKPSLQTQIDSILVKRPIEYKGINDYLRSFRRDTNKLKELITTFDQNNYLEGKAYSQNLLGIQYRNNAIYQKSIESHKQALETARKAQSIEFEVFSLNMLGVTYRKMDANRTALDYNQEALALADSVENPNLGILRGTAVSLNSMGNIYLLLRQYDLAIEQFKKSQKIERDINNKLGLAINYQNIGYAKDAQGHLEEALEYYNKSLEINHEINNDFGKVICNSSISNILIQQNKSEEAIERLNKDFATVKKIANTEYLSYHYLNLGWAETKLKRYKSAEANLLKGLEIAKEHNLPSSLSYAYYHLSELYQFTGSYRKAYDFFKKAVEFDDKITNERNIRYVNDLIIKYDSERKNNEIKSLAKQNEIAQLQISKNQNIWIILVVSFLLIFTLFFLNYRQRLHEKEKRILTLEQDVLRAQMNPHFIFNTLNSIKHYIINNEQKNAVHYLNKFSKLVRKILEYSSVKEISLKEELETMNLYMNIENIRFSNEIKFNLNTDESLNLMQVKVPPLVLQPFLENAIWHGLSSKKGEKL
ncbi:MAG: sensor histidine kinase [Flavobacteriaceae bacterium]|nr:sensor histidine kinase [Flavobacteriaceae bacterium]|tara:strand:- start:575293 stop:576954 length:1662 start_codon:yes stop_codon:yes gene_type:complete